MKVVCTGTTGFVGRHLVDRLTSDGHRVVRVIRRGASRAEGDVLLEDLLDVRAWEEALCGADVVCHLAAIAHSRSRREDEIVRVNVDVTEVLARASANVGVGHFVFMSSIKAVGEESTEGRAFSESDVRAPLDPYGRAKALAEERLERLRGSIRVSVLRSPLVYGAGVKGNFRRLMGLIDRGVPLPLASVENRRSLVFVGNLVDAIAKLSVSSTADGVFHVSDGHDVSTPELASRIGAAMGRRAKLFAFHVALLEACGAAFGKGDEVRRLTRSLTVNTRRIQDTIKWQPPFSLESGLQETAVWYEQASDRD